MAWESSHLSKSRMFEPGTICPWHTRVQQGHHSQLVSYASTYLSTCRWVECTWASTWANTWALYLPHVKRTT